MERPDTVEIYTASGENNAKVIKSFLEDNGIEALIKIDSSGDAIFGNIGGNSPLSNWNIYVSKEEAGKAKDALSEIQVPEESNRKRSSDFMNFGTYQAQEADILRRELMKNGVTVKKEYPGTSVGTDTTADANFSAYTLLVKGTDFDKAKKVRNKFNIQPI